MILYKFRTIAHDEPKIDIIRIVIADHYGHALMLLNKNWKEMSFKRQDEPMHQFIGEITQETTGIFNECEIVARHD